MDLAKDRYFVEESKKRREKPRERGIERGRAMESSSMPAPEAAAPSTAADSAIASGVGGEVEDGVEEMTLTVRWSGKEYTVRVCGDDSVAELKRRICEATTVLPKRQKLLYPKLAAKLNDESVLLSQLNLKPSVKMTMIGSGPP